MYQLLKILVIISPILLNATSFALSMTSLTQGLTPNSLVAELIDTSASNLTYSNIQYRGANNAAGLFTGGLADGLGMDRGIILSTGYIANAVGPNKCYKTTAVNSKYGDGDLDKLGGGTFDAAILEFDLVPTGDKLVFNYVFASEEYIEWTGSPFNDVFGFFLDGKNIALIPGTSTPVSINAVNPWSNSQYYNNNNYPFPTSLTAYNSEACRPGTKTPFGTEMDGFTVVLTATAPVTPGKKHHIKLAIADRGDYSLDSVVLIQGKSFMSPPPVKPTIVPPPPIPVPVPIPVPGKVVLADFSQFAETRSPTYTWKALEIASKYLLKILTEEQKVILEKWYSPGEAKCSTTCTITPELVLPDGNYQWLVQAANQTGVGSWSDVNKFTVALNPPPKVLVTVCQLYAIDDQEENNSQLLIFEQNMVEQKVLGPVHLGYDIEALDAHPLTKQLYGASGNRADKDKGALYEIDSGGGQPRLIGSLQFAEGALIEDISGLSFNPNTNNLWGWAQGKGLFRLDPTQLPNAPAELKWVSTERVEDLTWDETGEVLYLAKESQLLRYDGEQTHLLCNLPKNTSIEALEMGSGGLLLIGLHDNTALYQVDTQQLSTANNKACPLQTFPLTQAADIEGMAWVCTMQ